jgi:CPA1 family monovalent cation:H+ antiporter
MPFLDVAAVLLTLAAVFGWVNFKFLKLPTTIGVMLIGLVLSILLLLLKDVIPAIPEAADHFAEGIDFNRTLMDGMLSYLLFAGALHVNLDDLRQQKWVVALMASVGVVLSTFLVGTAAFYLLPLFGFEVAYVWCLVFGALISPTDPVAVLGLLKQAGAPKSLETKITGESLFNDGVGVVVYLAILGIAMGGGGGHGNHGGSGVGDIVQLFAVEAGGGILWGLALGACGFVMLRSIDNYKVEVLITLALVTAGYRVAMMWHISGPLAMVVAGLMIGNHGRSLAMSDTTRDHLDKFWELIDEVLNAVLFVLLGLELFVVEFSAAGIGVGLLLIVVVLAARAVSVSVPVAIMRRFREFTPGVIRVLTWGGLRGGISVALALGIPKAAETAAERDIILLCTYVVVIFSIAVQGLTLKPLIARIVR